MGHFRTTRFSTANATLGNTTSASYSPHGNRDESDAFRFVGSTLTVVRRKNLTGRDFDVLGSYTDIKGW